MLEKSSHASPLSDKEFIIYTPSALKEELLTSLHFFAKTIVFNDDYGQFEINGYRIWNSLFNGINPLSSFEKLQNLFPLLTDIKGSIDSQIKKGKELISIFKETDGNKNPFHFHPEMWKTLRPGQYKILKAVMKKHHSGIIFLPGGYGKTRTALAIVGSLNFNNPLHTQSLIVTQNEIIKDHWLVELGKSSIAASHQKKIRQSMDFITYRQLTKKPLLDQYKLIILDEVHDITNNVLNVLSKTKSLKIGLTASPEFSLDLEEKVFLIIGPIYYLLEDVEDEYFFNQYLPKEKINYFEILTALKPKLQTQYFSASNKLNKFKIASQNSNKDKIVRDLLKRHPHQKTIIIGEYIEQLERLAKNFNLKLITGKTSPAQRKTVYRHFNEGDITCFVSSSITNQAIDLPEADCLIQVSGKHQSKNEEIQRLGRILRKKNRPVYFYSIMTEGTIEETSSQARQAGLIHQGITIQRLSLESLDLRL